LLSGIVINSANPNSPPVSIHAQSGLLISIIRNKSPVKRGRV